MNLISAIKRKLGNLAGGVSSFIQNPIKTAQTGIQNWATQNPQASQTLLKFEQPVQKISSFMQEPYKPVVLPKIQTGYKGLDWGYDYLGKPLLEGFANIPRDIVGGGTKLSLDLGRTVGGQKVPIQKTLGDVGQLGTGILNAIMLPFGGGAVKTIVKEVGKKTLLKSIGKGALGFGKFGGAYGLTGGLQENQDEKNLLEYTKRVAGSTAIGGAGGAVLGGGVGALGYTAGKILSSIINAYKKVFPKATDKEAITASKEFFRNELGQFTKPKPREEVFYSEIDKYQKRPIVTGGKKEPIWYAKAREDLKMPKGGYRIEDIPMGLSIKPITPEERLRLKQPPVQGGVEIPQVPFQKDLDRFTALVKQNEKYQVGVPAIGKLPSSQAVADQMGIPHEELMSQVLGKAGKPLPKILPTTPGGAIPPEPVIPPPPEVPPINKVIEALKPLRQTQESLYTKERGARIGEFTKTGETVSGEKGFYEQLVKLKGQLPKVQFETLRKTVDQPTIDSLFDQVKTSPVITDWEKVTANNALVKMFGKEGTALPTKNELSLLSDVFGEEFTKAILDKRPVMEKVMSFFGDALSIPRSLLAGGFDMSFGLRQGIFGGYRHPKEWAGAFKEQFKYFFSEKAVNELNESIVKSPNYQMMRENKLSIMNLGEQLEKREEQFRSSLAEKIPIIGKFVRASARAYTGFANKMRADVFNKMVEVGKRTGDIGDPRYLKDMAKFINAMTGRGTLGLLEKVGTEVTSVLFSPRLLASRIQLLNPLYYTKLQPAVRKEALKTLFAYVAGSATLLELGKLGGFEVVTDPTNSDFLKLKKGNTRIDILGGFQQPIVLLARLIKGELTSSITGKKIKLGEGYKPLTRYDLINTYFENKTAPVMSFFLNWSKGTSFEGQPFDAKQEIIKRIIPMFIQDMADLYNDDPSSIPFGIPMFFGAGGQTYGGTEKNNLDTMIVQYDAGKGINPKLLDNVSVTDKADLLLTEIKKAKKDKTVIEKIKSSGLATDEVIAQAEKYRKLEKLGIMKADRELLTIDDPTARAQAVLDRLDSFVLKNQPKHLKLLIQAGIVTDEVKAEMRKLYK
ncbi:MAG: hypothetical protein UT24_C0016G0060 [Candidatus Woesebacteria bacterium GW2011_GWB1_39_12]|uniref:Large polyvalent protein associated domain-containing protein n=1 Tax=Candidatus Woesebacteria bacterium GW2011_GWB1_39_12 TaxID=1618574 RepID=A0A0G0MIK1_9BACT|nr:MAG: hypothetical protein UT24_C0016G0060 [Candidatus Woesebacteria bacterium GW2011_GWB1_39_12]